MLLIELGNYSITAAFVLAAFSAVASVWGGLRRRADLILAGRNAALAVFGLVTAASAALIWLLMARDYRVEYVAPKLHYFDATFADFEKVVSSMRIAGDAKVAAK